MDHIEFHHKITQQTVFKEITKLSTVVIHITGKTTTSAKTHSLAQHTRLDVKEEKPHATNPILTYDSRR